MSDVRVRLFGAALILVAMTTGLMLVRLLFINTQDNGVLAATSISIGVVLAAIPQIIGKLRRRGLQLSSWLFTALVLVLVVSIVVSFTNERLSSASVTTKQFTVVERNQWSYRSSKYDVFVLTDGNTHYTYSGGLAGQSGAPGEVVSVSVGIGYFGYQILEEP